MLVTTTYGQDAQAWKKNGNVYCRDWMAKQPSSENSWKKTWECVTPIGEIFSLVVSRCGDILSCSCQVWADKPCNDKNCDHTDELEFLLLNQECEDSDKIGDNGLVDLKLKCETLEDLARKLDVLGELGFNVPSRTDRRDIELSPDGYYRAVAEYEGR